MSKARTQRQRMRVAELEAENYMLRALTSISESGGARLDCEVVAHKLSRILQITRQRHGGQVFYDTELGPISATRLIDVIVLTMKGDLILS